MATHFLVIAFPRLMTERLIRWLVSGLQVTVSFSEMPEGTAVRVETAEEDADNLLWRVLRRIRLMQPPLIVADADTPEGMKLRQAFDDGVRSEHQGVSS